MAFDELRGFAREIYLEKKVEDLQRTYKLAQKSLRKKLENIDLSDFQKVRTEALLSQVNREIAALDQSVRKWSKKNMKFAYNGGIEEAEDRLRKMGVTRFVNYDARIHRSAVNTLIDDVTLDFLAANQAMKAEISRYIRSTQQRLLEDREISRLLAQGLIEGETRRDISRTLTTEFRKRMKEERFMTINGRHYRPEAYSRLVTRTRFIEAQSQASVNTALQYGVDLVQVSVHHHPQEDPCSPFQGKIFSISGADSDFPPLTDRPPYHPNCKHVLLPITRESLEDRGLLENSVRFSNSNRPAGVRSFKEFEEEINV